MSSNMTTLKAGVTPAPLRNPKDSMKSTWRQADRSTWTPFHWFYEVLNIHARDLNRDVPVHAKSEKVPHVPWWQGHAWILIHALPPIIIQHFYTVYTGNNMGPIGVFGLYLATFQIIGIHQTKQMRKLGHIYGYLDGDKHARDEVPDVGVSKVFWSLINTSLFRTLMHLVFAYRTSEPPSTIHWLILPFEIGFYEITLDFWFYWYHRVMHQFDALWKYHRTHHLTKHPNPLLTLYADEEQEFFDIVGIPLLAWGTLKLLGFPMGFYEWWLCNQYCVFSELAGHSGLRISSTPPSPFASILTYFHAELAIEDHDLHHRTGWKKSHNYGKQTRLWDRIFGTCTDRLESDYDNIDFENTANIFLGW